MKFPTQIGRVAVNTGAPGSEDQYQNGVRLNADPAALFTTTATIGALASAGLLLDPAGAVVTIDCPVMLPDGVAWVNGLPIALNGALCTSAVAPQAWANGIGFTDFGAVSVGPAV